jgi:Na+-translocating ferredoxin:NAD+ oxidoreductase RNF subunit RnfB
MKKNADFHHALKILKDVCTGCTHCMNICPTEAIRVKNGKAELISNRCVDCGFCFRVCPVNAIIVEQDDFNRIFEYKTRVALVPAVLTGQFPENISTRQIHSELMELGFTHIFEVEQGVEVLHEAMMEYIEKHGDTKPLISSFCPAIVRLIQVKFPGLVDNIIHLKPPLDVTALYVSRQLMDEGHDEHETGIFYVTPCAAKIAAVKSPVGDRNSPITGVINMDFIFNKVYRRIKQGGGNSSILPEVRQVSERSVLWSLTNGESAHAKGRCLAVDEIHNVINFLEQLENEDLKDIDFLELRACDESCAGGVLTTENRFFTVERLKKRAAEIGRQGTSKEPVTCRSIIHYKNRLKEEIGLEPVQPRSMLKLDEDMSEAMKKMKRVEEIGKYLPDVDCGACGSPSCQSFAEDIVQGYSRLNQCVFVQRIFEKKGILTAEESFGIMRDIWGSDKMERNS